MAANRNNWRHRIKKCYLSPKACQYLVSTRITRIEPVCFPAPHFSCLCSVFFHVHHHRITYAPIAIGVGQIIIIIIIILIG